MYASWWPPAMGAVVLLALLAAVVDGWARRGRRGRRVRRGTRGKGPQEPRE